MATAKENRSKISRPAQDASAWARWRGAAKRFKGIGKQLEARAELRYIRLYTNGYQVVFQRADNYLSRCFCGFDEATLQRAMRFRDEVLRERGEQRVNRVPTEVLEALGLSAEVMGIYRLPSRSVYRIFFKGEGGRRQMKQFYFRRVPEVDAYAAAIDFLRDLKAGRRL